MGFFKFLLFEELLLFDFIKDLFGRSDDLASPKRRSGRKLSALLERKLDGVLGSTGFEGVRTEGVPGGVEARWTQGGLHAAAMLKELTHSGAITTRARFRIEYPSLGLGLKLKPTHPDRRAQTPDELPFHVKAHDPAALDAFLTPERVARLAPLFDQLHKPYVTDTTASFEVASLPIAASALVQEAAHLSQLAGALRSAPDDGNPAHAVPAGSDANDSAATDGATGSSPGTSPGAPEHPPTEVAAVDLESVISRWESGAATAALQDTPSSSASEAPNHMAAPEPTTPSTASAPQESVPQASAPDTSDSQAPALDVATVTTQLFASNAASFEVKQRFEAELAGRTVTWRGTLERVDEFRSDIVFEGAGTKLTFELPSVAASDATDLSRPCHAVVQLAAADGRDLELGAELTFTGKLLACDPFMRTVFLTAGRLATR